MKKVETSPLKVFRPFGAGVEVRLFGRPTNWSIAELSNEPLTPGTHFLPDCYDIVARVAHEAGVCELLAPKPSDFNARIVGWRDDLRVIYQPDDPDIPEDDPHPWRYVRIARGAMADGVELPLYKGVGWWLSSADCPAVVSLSPSGRLICLHAGLDSLWDRAYILGGNPPRRDKSVVDALARRLGDEMSRSRFFLTCGISPTHFSHPWDHEWFGSVNRRMTEYFLTTYDSVLLGEPREGELSLKAIVREQLVRYGVPVGNVSSDSIDTFEDTGADGQPLWWSARRGDGPKRNGVLVFRTE